MRAYLPKNQQRVFINKILSKIPIKEASKLSNLSERTIRDWRREISTMDYNIIKKLSQKTSVPLPKNIKTKDKYWYVHKGASIGGFAVLKKYGRIGGDPKIRKQKWYEWWEKKGKYKQGSIINLPVSINKPTNSKNLAEFAGIIMGDGEITNYQIRITLHHKDDKEYGKFVINLIKKLFNTHIGVYHYKKYSVIRYVVSRIELVKFCTEKLGLKKGNKIKQQIDIPGWIKKDKKYSIACVRGLIDTDGCVFDHKYKVKGKWYSYKKISFTSYSKPLRIFVFNILKKNGLNPRLAWDRDVRLDSKKDMQKYFQIFGSNNPKHLRKYNK